MTQKFILNHFFFNSDAPLRTENIYFLSPSPTVSIKETETKLFTLPIPLKDHHKGILDLNIYLTNHLIQ